MPSFEDLQRINKANSIINRSNISIGLRPMYLHAQEEEQETEEFFEEHYQEENFKEDFEIEQVEVSEFEKDKTLSNNLKRDIREKLLETQQREIVTAEEYYSQVNENDDQNFLLSQEDFAEKNHSQTFYQDEVAQYQSHEDDYIDDLIEEPNYETSYNTANNFFNEKGLDSEPLFETAAKLKNPENIIKTQTGLSFSKTVMYTACAVIAAVYLIFTFKPVHTAPVQEVSFEETKLQELTKTVNSIEPRSLIITSGNFSKETAAISYQKALKDKLGVPLKLVKDGESFSIQIGPSYANHDDALLVFDELSRYSVKNLSIKVAS